MTPERIEALQKTAESAQHGCGTVWMVAEELGALCSLAKSAIPGGRVAEDDAETVREFILAQEEPSDFALTALARLAARAQGYEAAVTGLADVTEAVLGEHPIGAMPGTTLDAVRKVMAERIEALARASDAERQRNDRERDLARHVEAKTAALRKVDELESRCAVLSAAGQALSEHADKTAGAPLGAFEIARNAMGGTFAALPNMERADTMAKDDPCPCLTDSPIGAERMCPEHDAPSLRDEFAKAAMQGLLANHERRLTTEAISREAYAVADKMLAERNKK
jgi:hypothetical protein